MTNCSLGKLAHEVLASDSFKSQSVSLSPEKLSQLPRLSYDLLYSSSPNQEVLKSRPWKNLPKYFTLVLVSALALVKMSVHAKLGGSIEVMGMLTGKVVGNTLVVMDVYSLPVEGTETRVNAQSEAYEYMVQYLDHLKEVGREEHIVGWYHSHPGYGCWLSGIDVATQSLNQNFQDPYLAIVVDPILTVNQGKVDIGAFRTFPIGYTANKKSDNAISTVQIKSKGRKHDFGMHADKYYALDIKFFKSSADEALIDTILNKSWISNLLQSTSSREEYDLRLASKVESLLSIKREAVSNSIRQNVRLNATFESIVERESGPPLAGVDRMEQGDTGSIDRVRSSSYCSEMEADGNDVNGDDDEDDDDDDEDEDDDDDDDEEGEEGADTQDDRMTDNPDNSEDKNAKKRVLRTSSEDSKSSLYFEPSQSRTRKRFATGDTGTVLNNEFKYKMQLAQAEIKRQLRSVSKVCHSELQQVITARTRNRVFGGLSE